MFLLYEDLQDVLSYRAFNGMSEMAENGYLWYSEKSDFMTVDFY
jgi:hypothetical protein